MFAHRGVVSSRMLFVQATISSHPVDANPGTLQPGRPRSSHPIVMMVDTGARFSVVADDVLVAMGLAPMGYTDVRTSLHHVVPRPAYRIALSLEFLDNSGQQSVAELILNVIGRPPLAANLPSNMGIPHEGLLGM